MKNAIRCIITLVAIAALLPATALRAQDKAISGTVTDGADGAPVAGAIVTLRNPDNRIVKHAGTNQKGEFRLTTTADLTGHTLNFAMMGYAAHSVPADGISGPLEIVLTPAPNAIREIQVKAPEITLRNDTLVYNVDKYTGAEDRSIGDVLKKLPGVEVKESGQIEYQGKPINKLYIDGNDIVGGRHGLATDNISAKDVKSVEVMENHQPIKSLQDIDFSDQAGLNLKLKDDAKGRWVGTAGLGAGFSPLLMQGSLFGMRIGRGWQGLQTLKANNTGVNLGREATNFSYSDAFGAGSGTLPDYISIGTGSAPLADRRTRFNRSAMFSSNNSRKISDDYKVDVRLNYLAERLDAESSTAQEYYFEDGSALTIEDSNNMTSMRHSLHAEAGVEANRDEFFLSNRLAADMEWRDTEMSVTGTTPNSQFASLPSMKVANNFSLVKRIGRKALTVSSVNQYLSKPHELTVEREGALQRQTADASSFYSNTSASYNWTWHKWQLSARVGFTANLRSLESELTGLETDEFPLVNNSSTNYFRTYATPSLTYNTGRFRAALTLPLSYYRYRFNDRAGEGLIKSDDLLLSPSVSINYKVSSRWRLYGSAGIGKQPVNEANFFTGLILSDFRSLRTGIIDFSNGESRNASAGFEYKNPINSFFMNGSVSRSRHTSVYTTSQTFVGGGDYIVYSPVAQRNDTDAWSARWAVSKGLDKIKGLVGVEAAWSDVSAAMIRDGALTPFTSRTLTVAPRINGRIFKWCSAEYRMSYMRSMMSGASEENSTDTYTQSLTLNFYPARRFNFSVTAEHYYNQVSASQSKHFVFADVSAIYRLNDNWELSLSATNLLDEREYSYVILGDLSSARAAYRIRPRNVIMSLYFRF